MTSGPSKATLCQLGTLFRVGSFGGMSDPELLERFAGRVGDDEAAERAFEALVERHGPMVLAVCRSVLGDRHEAEDAFQASFLVLARRARSIRRRDSVGPWLHGVAQRVSARLKARAARRRVVEARGAGPGGRDGRAADEGWPELHEEVARLPEAYRVPVVLCYLQGLTYDEAADRLRWPIGTLKVRLARARALLRARLIRRGLAPTVGFLGSAASVEAAAVPGRLASATVSGATRLAAGGRTGGGLISDSVAALAAEAHKAMLLTKLRCAGAAGLVVIFAIGAIAHRAPGSQELAPRERDGPGQPPPGAGAPAGPGAARSLVVAPRELEAHDGHGELLMYALDARGERILDPDAGHWTIAPALAATAKRHYVEGSLVVETLFNVPGIGQYFVKSVDSLDYGMIMGTTLFYAALVMVINLVVDLMYGVIDPRVRLGAGART